MVLISRIDQHERFDKGGYRILDSAAMVFKEVLSFPFEWNVGVKVTQQIQEEPTKGKEKKEEAGFEPTPLKIINPKRSTIELFLFHYEACKFHEFSTNNQILIDIIDIYFIKICFYGYECVSTGFAFMAPQTIVHI